MKWKKAYINGQRCEVRPYIPQRHLMIESTIPPYWEARFPDGRIVIVPEEVIDFIR